MALILAVIAIVISIVAAAIVYFQLNIARSTLKLGLYKRRFNIYASVVNLYVAAKKGSYDDMEKAAIPFVLSFRESRFLFDDKDDIYKMIEKIEKAYASIAGYEKIKTDNADAESLSAHHCESVKGHAIFDETLPVLEDNLIKYIDFRKIKL